MAKVTLVLEDDYDTDELKINFDSDPAFPVNEESDLLPFEDMTPAQTFGIMARLFLEAEFKKIAERAEELKREEAAETVEE